MENKKFLDKFAINIQTEVKNGKIEPVIGRDEEIRNLIRILSRKSKNNPVLIGEPGVGKTAIVEGLALRINQGDVPDNLKLKKVYSLDLGSLVAGAKFQGEFEERLKGVIQEVKDDSQIILFIDEIHMLIGAGKTTGAMDAANLLKPMLARGELNCIGATTLKEYRENIEKDTAFERRFQKILVNEPSREESINILRGLKNSHEMYHGVNIDDEALVAAVDLSIRYINDRFLPDKAIDLIDEACASINVQVNSQPEELENLNRKITALEIEKKAIQKDKKQKERYNEVKKELEDKKQNAHNLQIKWNEQKEIVIGISETKQQIKQLKDKLTIAKSELDYKNAAEIEYSLLPKAVDKLENLKQQSQQYNLVSDVVTQEDITKVISRYTKIPLEKISMDNKTKLLQLEKNLNNTVLGQQEAAKELASTIIRNRVNITDPNRPIGSFLFMGPTGVGKTEMTKQLAIQLFDSPKNICRIDMSEYMEKHSVSRLIGAPPGYIGYEEGGTLTEYVRRNPYSIILFDEIEKAHIEVLNLLLQILDEGHVTDSKGINVNFKNTIIIMTTNIGSLEILNDDNINEASMQKLLLNYFKPEFINRIDNIIQFNKLNKENCQGIIKIELEKLNERLSHQDKKIIYDDKLIEYIYKEGYDAELGARPLKRFIQNNLETKLALAILEESKNEYEITVDNGQIIIK